ncbi:MAG: hypothetical protein ACPG5O_04075 [Pseudoalteromonas tetraodonis]
MQSNNPHTLVKKVVNMRRHLVKTNRSHRNKAVMLKLINQFTKYANYWTNKPEALRKYLARHSEEFFLLIPPTNQGASLKEQFIKTVLS